jgi:shikimate kinase
MMKNMDSKNIVLIGMPAVGKSTVGQLLSQKIGFDFIDTDDLIQTGEKNTLAQIIQARGMDTFLEIESQYLMGLSCSRSVISTGGSVVYKPKAMAHLSKISRVVYLEIGLDHLKTRLSDLASRGVAIGPGQGITELYQERICLYERYKDIIIHCGMLTPQQVVEQIASTLFL